MAKIIGESAWAEAYSGKAEVGELYYDDDYGSDLEGWVARWSPNGPEASRGDESIDPTIEPDDTEEDIAQVVEEEAIDASLYEVVWVRHPDGLKGHIYASPPEPESEEVRDIKVLHWDGGGLKVHIDLDVARRLGVERGDRVEVRLRRAE